MVVKEPLKKREYCGNHVKRLKQPSKKRRQSLEQTVTASKRLNDCSLSKTAAAFKTDCNRRALKWLGENGLE